MTPAAAARAVLAMAMAAPVLLGGQRAGESEGPERFRTVDKWTGTVSVSMTGSGRATGHKTVTEWSVSQKGNLSFELDRAPGGLSWEGPQTGTASIDNTFAFRVDGKPITRQHLRGNEQFSAASGRLSIDLERGVYSIDLEMKMPVEVTGTIGGKTVAERRTAPWFPPPLPPKGMSPTDPRVLEALAVPGVAEMPLPASGLTLSGSKTLPEGGIPASLANYQPGTMPITVTWSFAPARELEVVVDVDGYESWMPRPGRDEAAVGNRLRVRADLQKRGGGAPSVTAKQFDFEFVEVSRLPGVAINFPAAGAAKTDPDLRFDGAGDDAKKSVPARDNTASVEITAHDGGATAILKVTATLDDGAPIVGYLKGRPGLTQIPLPKRREGSRVADAWRASVDGSNEEDFEDLDALPAGDGHRGDGLTVFEEYRGFFSEWRFQRGNAKRKEIFVHDKVGGLVVAGLRAYEAATEVIVRRVDTEEVAPDRVVNVNSPDRKVAQHAVRISLWGSAHADAGLPGRPADGEIKLPAVFRGVANGTHAFRAGEERSLTSMVAHETAHRTNLYHHGDTDITINWDMTVLEDRRLRVTEQRVDQNGNAVGGPIEVTLLREDGSPATSADPAARPGTRITMTRVDLGMDNGEHSGDVDCFMRYDSSVGYKSRREPDRVRYVVKERAGLSLCTSPRGTGVNAANRPEPPQPRYVDASQRRGNCTAQICVSDAAPPHGDR